MRLTPFPDPRDNGAMTMPLDEPTPEAAAEQAGEPMSAPVVGPVAEAADSEPVDVCLHERVFEMVSSTSSAVDPVSPTRFVYRESGGVLWGEYTGDTVEFGRFCGQRSGSDVRVLFVHRGTSGVTTSGEADSVITRDPDGALRLIERYLGPDGEPHLSVCREVLPAAPA